MQLNTERLFLRELDPADSPAVLDFVVRNLSFLRPWEPLRDPSYFTIPGQRTILQEARRERDLGNRLMLWLIRREDGLLIGNVHLFNIVRGVSQSATVSYKTDQFLTRHGYMTEALQAVMDHAFGPMALHRLEANIMPRNAASLGLAKKLGFRDEGLSRKYLRINGVWEDHIRMARLAEDD